MKKRSLIILAAGKGTRVELGYNKLLYKINKKTILEHTIDIFKNIEIFNEIIIVISKEDENEIINLNLNKNYKIAYGEKTRAKSLYSGMKLVTNEIVYIHDGARATFNNANIKEIEKAIDENKNIKCFTLANKTVDTVSEIKDGYISKNLNRDNLVNIQTPQVVYKSSYEKIYDQNSDYTDETTLFKNNNYKVKVILTNQQNFKVTTKEDIQKLKDYYEKI